MQAGRQAAMLIPENRVEGRKERDDIQQGLACLWIARPSRQHITADASTTGGQIDCPTCFQKLIVPDAPKGDLSKLILNAALANSRRFQPEDTKGRVDTGGRAPTGRFPAAATAASRTRRPSS